jgi:parvulin-like peptidyl-prolyl isomerase
MAKASKKKQNKEQTAQKTKKQIAFSRKEARQNRIILISIGLLAVLVVAVLTFGLLREFGLKPSEPVAIVEGTKIRSDDYDDLVAALSYNLVLNLSMIDTSQEGSDFLTSYYQQQLEFVPQAALEQLIEDVLIQEEADKLGLTVSDEEVEQAIFAQPQTPVTDTATIPTPIPQEELDARYRASLQQMGVSDSSFREIVRRDLLRSKLQEYLASQVETTGPIADARIIQTETEQEARDALSRIDSGEDFAIVAQEVSTDTLTAENGGDLGWVTIGQISSRYGEDLERSVFSMSPGDIRVLQSNDRWYVVELIDLDENGPLPEAVLSARQASALSDWLEARKASPDVEIERILDAASAGNPFLTPQLP